MFVCLFVCLGGFDPLKKFSLVWRRHHYRWKTEKFDFCPALMAIEQWGFCSAAHILWHPFILFISNCRAFGSGDVTTRFNDLGLSQLRFEHPTFRMRGDCSNWPRHHRSLNLVFYQYLEYSLQTWPSRCETTHVTTPGLLHHLLIFLYFVICYKNRDKGHDFCHRWFLCKPCKKWK